MADAFHKSPENIPGRFYVDDTCIDCDLCRSNAPEFFHRIEDGGYTAVLRQPATPGEIAAAMDALADCPSDSIGCDGQ